MMCQSVKQPSIAEYWHIGAMTIRLASVKSPICTGANKRGCSIEITL